MGLRAQSAECGVQGLECEVEGVGFPGLGLG